MRIVELSNHPRDMLQIERKRRAVDTERDQALHQAQVITLLNGSVPGIAASERHQLEQLIIRDHRFCEKRYRS